MAERRRRESAGPASGVPARRYSWPPFQPGHQLSRKHGGYSMLGFDEETAALAEVLRDAVPVYAERLDPAIEHAARVGVHARRKLVGAAADPDNQTLDLEAHRWSKRWSEELRELGLTPAALVRMGIDLAHLSGREPTLADYLEQRAREDGAVVEAAAEEPES